MTEQKDKELSAEYYLDRIFTKFEDQEKRLSTIQETATKAITETRDKVREQKENVFADEAKTVYEALDAIRLSMGNTNWLGLELELRHKQLSQPEVLAQEATRRAQMLDQQQQILPLASGIANQPGQQGEHGFFWWRAEVRKAKAAEHIAEMAKQPQMTEIVRQTDFMNYIRDIPAEVTKIKKWIGGALTRLRKYPKEETVRYVLYRQLRDEFEILSSLAESFSTTAIDFRTELVRERTVAYAQAMTALQQAKYLAQNQPMSMAQMYQRQRMEMGAQDVGGS
jgi:hypothetical protein